MDTTELKKLAEAATQGPWVAAGPSFGSDKPQYLEEVLVDREGDEDDTYTVCQAPAGLQYESSHDMAFIAAAHPAAVLAMIAEIDRLKAELECARGDMSQAYRIMERDMKDAERYRYARSRSGMKAVGLLDEPVPEGVSHGHDLWIDSRMELEAASAKLS
jgi:hypothetical protein